MKNNHCSPILIKLGLNENKIGQIGLMLNPYQKIFLDRDLVNNKKFIFNTYDIDKQDQVKAKQYNGKIFIEVFESTNSQIHQFESAYKYYVSEYPYKAQD